MKEVEEKIMQEFESRREKLKTDIEEEKRLETNNTEAITGFTESKTQGMKEFREKVYEHDEKFRKQEFGSKLKRTNRLPYFIAGKKRIRKVNYGPICNRVKRSAGNILLGDRVAAWVTSTRDRRWIRLGGFMLMSLYFWTKLFVELAFNGTGVILKTKFYNQMFPNFGKGSRTCTGISAKRMDLY